MNYLLSVVFYIIGPQTPKRGEGGLNEAEQEYISFIVKIANWNVSIHNLPEFDRERAFHDWFLTHDPNK